MPEIEETANIFWDSDFSFELDAGVRPHRFEVGDVVTVCTSGNGFADTFYGREFVIDQLGIYGNRRYGRFVDGAMEMAPTPIKINSNGYLGYRVRAFLGWNADGTPIAGDINSNDYNAYFDFVGEGSFKEEKVCPK